MTKNTLWSRRIQLENAGSRFRAVSAMLPKAIHHMEEPSAHFGCVMLLKSEVAMLAISHRPALADIVDNVVHLKASKRHVTSILPSSQESRLEYERA